MEDPGATFDYEKILAADEAGKFRRHCRADLTPPTAGGALWVRLDLLRTKNAPRDWVLTLASLQIDEARLYQVRENGLFSLKRTGRAVPADARDIVSRWPAFGVALDAELETRVFLRLTGVTTPFASIELLPATRFAEREAIDLLIIAAIIGFLIAMLAYNIVIYVRSRLHQCLYYFGYLGCMILHIIIYDGLVYRFVNLRLAGELADGLSQLFAVAAAICILIFGRLLLRLRTAAPLLNTLIGWSAVLIAVSIGAEIAGWIPPLIASTVMPLLAGVMLVGCAVVFAFRGSRPAIYFSLSFLALLVGLALDTLGYFYPVALTTEQTVWTALIGVQQNWSFHIGICAEALLITFAITYFIRDMQTDVLDARAEADQTRQENVAARQEFTEKYTDLAQRVGIVGVGDATEDTPSSSDTVFRDNAIRIIQENLGDETFDVAQLAELMAMSERTLRRRVRGAVGVSPVEFLRRERLERAREYLENGSYQTVAEVARAVGINSPGYFSRVYREAFDKSPRDALKNS